MRTSLSCRVVAICALMLFVPVGRPAGKYQDASRSGASSQVKQFDLSLRRIKITRFLSDRVELSANVEVIPGASAVLQKIRFDGMRVDGKTPVYLESLEGEYALQRAIPLTLPPLRMALYYSDFPTPASMEAILDAQSMHVTGNVWAGLKLSLLGKLSVQDMHPATVLTVDQDVPLERDTVDAPTQLGVGILSLAQTVLGTSASIIDRVAGVRIQSDDGVADERDTRSVLIVRTTYRIVRKEESKTKACVRLGFWVDERHALIPAEALEPWEYSIENAEELAKGSKLDQASIETTVVPTRPNSYEAKSWFKTQGDFQVLKKGVPDRAHLILPSGASVSLNLRESQGNYALLEFSKASGVSIARVAAAVGHVHALRRVEGAEQRLRTVDLGRAASRDLTQMPRPIDEYAFGSPLLLVDGAGGMIVGERTVVLLSDLSNMRP